MNMTIMNSVNEGMIVPKLLLLLLLLLLSSSLLLLLLLLLLSPAEAVVSVDVIINLAVLDNEKE